MGWEDEMESTRMQTCEQPMEALDAVLDHANAVRQLVSWDRVGILYDEGPQAILTVLLEAKTVVSVARFCLSPADSVSALLAYRQGKLPMELRCWQGHNIVQQQAHDLSALTDIWRDAAGQRVEQTEADWLAFFEQLAQETHAKGRGRAVSASTRNQVLLDAHGRCMFDGCGADLTEDPVTGERGNFATLAHNVASSEAGTRGVLYLSDRLSDEASNILLLCETHHRLVDTVAKADYPANELSAMRERFCRDAAVALDGLALTPIAGDGVAWPVHSQVISVPSSVEVARALQPIGARLDGQLRTVSANDEVLRLSDVPTQWRTMPRAVANTADRILMQARDDGYRAALFAIGLMPALIALGAKIGNKSGITPMLRYRENGLWYWPVGEPRGEFYTVEGLERLKSRENEVCLLLGLTAVPTAMHQTAESLGVPVVSVVARPEWLGNGALGHPDDGAAFRQRMQELLHRLRDGHGVAHVHVLPCASNAASVFFGQAFDNYHPALTVYDFADAGMPMVPRVHIRNSDGACTVETVDVVA